MASLGPSFCSWHVADLVVTGGKIKHLCSPVASEEELCMVDCLGAFLRLGEVEVTSTSEDQVVQVLRIAAASHFSKSVSI